MEAFGTVVQSAHSPTEPNINAINAAEDVQSRNESQQMHSGCVDEETLIKKKKQSPR